MIVADTNLIVYLLVRGQDTPDAERAYSIDRDWVAPSLWRSEFRNALTLFLRQGFLGLDEAAWHVASAERLMQGKSYEVDSIRVLALTMQSGCSAYDCEFATLAQQLGVPLVTSDRRLAAKFRPTAILLREFVRTPRP